MILLLENLNMVYEKLKYPTIQDMSWSINTVQWRVEGRDASDFVYHVLAYRIVIELGVLLNGSLT